MASNAVMIPNSSRIYFWLIAFFLLISDALFYPTPGHAQQNGAVAAMTSAALPDAPTPAASFAAPLAASLAPQSGSSLASSSEPQAASTQAAPTGATSDSSKAAQPGCAPDNSDEGKQTKRILGVLPNFRAVSVNSHLPPQSPKEKFIGFSQESFDYSSFILVGLLASVDQIQGSTPEFHTGPPAFGRYYWHNFADQTDENLFVDFLLPTALHEDARYYTLGRRSGCKHHPFVVRLGYALSRVLVTRTDAGTNRFNFSEIVGSGASSGIANLYYPGSQRGWNQTGQRWLLNIGIDGISFAAREFWPDINHLLFHN